MGRFLIQAKRAAFQLAVRRTHHERQAALTGGLFNFAKGRSRDNISTPHKQKIYTYGVKLWKGEIR